MITALVREVTLASARRIVATHPPGSVTHARAVLTLHEHDRWLTRLAIGLGAGVWAYTLVANQH